MSPLLEGIPAVFYSGLYVLQVYGKLEQTFEGKKINIIVYITDFPPATQIKIDGGQFEIIPLEKIKDPQELEALECDGYVAAPLEILYGGVGAIMKGIREKKVKIKNVKVLLSLAKILAGGVEV